MRETRVNISGTCAVVLTEWEHTPATVCIEYTERQNDSWYRDSVTEADIDAQTAGAIVKVLIRAFPQLTPSTEAASRDE